MLFIHVLRSWKLSIKIQEKVQENRKVALSASHEGGNLKFDQPKCWNVRVKPKAKRTSQVSTVLNAKH